MSDKFEVSLRDDGGWRIVGIYTDVVVAKSIAQSYETMGHRVRIRKVKPYKW